MRGSTMCVHADSLGGLFWHDAVRFATLINQVKRDLVDPAETWHLCPCMFEVLADLTLNLDPEVHQPHHLRVLSQISTRPGAVYRPWRAAVWIKVGQLEHPQFDDATRLTAARFAYFLHIERHTPDAPDLTSEELETMSIAELADVFRFATPVASA